jgi:hypothetical protein
MRFASSVLILILAAASLKAQSPPDNSVEGKAAAFTGRLLSAISHRDMNALVSMIRFPVTVHSGEITLPVANRTALAKAYDTIFTPELGCALERASSGSGRAGAPAVRKESKGLSIGRGAVHIEPSGDSFAITRIDAPAGASPAAARSQPKHVDVPSGQVQFAGTLAAGGADRYIVTARRGDVLQARIERFQGRAAGVRVVDVKSSKTISTGADSARVVSATAQQPGELAVEVTRLTFCAPSVSYLLTISKKR